MKLSRYSMRQCEAGTGSSAVCCCSGSMRLMKPLPTKRFNGLWWRTCIGGSRWLQRKQNRSHLGFHFSGLALFELLQRWHAHSCSNKMTGGTSTAARYAAREGQSRCLRSIRRRCGCAGDGPVPSTPRASASWWLASPSPCTPATTAASTFI